MRMQTVMMGRSALRGSRLAYGCWRLADDGATGDAGRAAVRSALEAGYTVFDHADIYGHGMCERIFGEVLAESPGVRDRLVLVTKCGIRRAGEPAGAPYRYDASRQHIVTSCEGSLRRLGVDVVDVFLLHRPDPLMDPEEVASAFDGLRRSGKAREFGVSNFAPNQVEALQGACGFPLVVNQVEISLARWEPLVDGTLDQCLAEGITPMAWSPLAGGKLADGARRVLPSQERYGTEALVRELDAVAEGRGVGRSAVALAWLLRHPAGMVPVVGSVHPERIRAAAKASEVGLSREEWYRLYTVARGMPLP